MTELSHSAPELIELAELRLPEDDEFEERIRQEWKSPQDIESLVQYDQVDHDGITQRFSVTMPPNQEPQGVIALHYEWANSFAERSPFTVQGPQFVFDAIVAARTRHAVVGFPNNNLRTFETYSRDARRELKSGDFGRLARARMIAAEKYVPAGTKLHSFGASEGGAVAAASIKVGDQLNTVNLSNVGSIEAPNSTYRTLLQMGRAFQDTGGEDFLIVKKRSGVDAMMQRPAEAIYTEGTDPELSKIEAFRSMAGMPLWVLEAYGRASNRDKIIGFRRGTFEEDLNHLETHPQTRALIGWATLGSLAPAPTFRGIASRLQSSFGTERVEAIEIPGGHTISSDPFLMGSLARRVAG